MHNLLSLKEGVKRKGQHVDLFPTSFCLLAFVAEVMDHPSICLVDS